MGTNYYAVEDACKCCGHSYIKVHIGKSSAGWTFTFHATDTIKNYKQWIEFLSLDNIKIFDEYNKECSLEDFEDMVENKKDAKLNHAKECAGERYDHSFLDEDENSFSEGEFS